MKIIMVLISKINLSMIVAAITSILNYRASNNNHAKQKAEARTDEYEQIIEDIEVSRSIDEDVSGMSPDDVDRELHDNDWFRKE